MHHNGGINQETAYFVILEAFLSCFERWSDITKF